MEINADNRILVLDFDHTLFLSNSTEEYLNSAKPRTLCALLLALLDWLKVWNLFPGNNKRVVYRDALRIIAISICFPWTYFFYKKRISSLLREHLNAEIVELLASKSWEKVIIASNGFGFIIKPLLDEINIQTDHILHSPVFSMQDSIRAMGKRFYLKQILTTHELNQATFISDNPEDRDLQGFVNEFIFYENQQAKRFRAGQDVYIPFVYTHASKRGNSNHFFNVVICDDYTIILLAFVFSNTFSILILLGLLSLVFSFWCIYEACYFENDLFEFKYESKHKNLELIEYIKKVKDFPLEQHAWVWAIGLGCLGLVLLQADTNSMNTLFSSQLFIKLLFWTLWLVAARLTFRAYTHSPFNYRVTSYPILQLFRLAGPALFLPLNPYGAFLIIAQSINRWFGYLMYRTGGDPKAAPRGLVRHIIFVFLVLALAVVQNDMRMLISSHFLVIFCWSIIRGNLKLFVRDLLDSASTVRPPILSEQCKEN